MFVASFLLHGLVVANYREANSLANSFVRSPNSGTGDERFNGRILAEFEKLLVTEEICKIIAVMT